MHFWGAHFHLTPAGRTGRLKRLTMNVRDGKLKETELQRRVPGSLLPPTFISSIVLSISLAFLTTK